MTAIYLIWNNSGFALAADSNQTVDFSNQAWVDPVDKIIRVGNHQLAFGAAGAATIGGIDITEFVRAWSNTLQKEEYPEVLDYVLDFLNYFQSQNFPYQPEVADWVTSAFKSELEEIKEFLDVEHRSPGDLDIEWKRRVRNSGWNLNLFSTYWDELINTADFPELTPGVRDKLTKLQRIQDSLKNGGKLRTLRSVHFFSEKEIGWYSNIFQEVFGVPLDLTNLYHQEILGSACMVFESLLNFKPRIESLFVGFGKNDWIPSAYQVCFYTNLLGIPRVAIKNVPSPKTDWYVNLGIETGVDEIVNGLSDPHREKLIDAVKDHIKSKHLEAFEESLKEFGRERFSAAMSKMDLLTPARLEYVARLFVEIESLHSYLNEPVPGVGGNTKVISMTKSTFSEKIIPEML